MAVSDGEVVGTVAVEFFEKIDGPVGDSISVEGETRICATDCSLQRLYVRPKHRGGGLGRTLFETAIREARGHGCRAMEIWSDKRFSAAHRLYQKLGAQIVADRICDDPDVSPEWGLRLDL